MKAFRIHIAITLLCCPTFVSAHDFEISTKGGQSLYFNITDSVKRTVEVTYPGSITDAGKKQFQGDLVLTSQVRYKGKVYDIKAIGPKAFSGNTQLKSIELPTGLTSIGNYAFEGCTSLSRIAFPGHDVEIGTGAFFRCQALSSVVLGNEWTAVNLKEFQWSKVLKRIKIPARVKSIRNLKSLPVLESIEVDSDNQNFHTDKGILYSKNGKTLLGCPRAYKDTLSVASGTKEVRWGAIADCRSLSCVILPSSLQILSFREFSMLPRLTAIVMKADSPIMTASQSGKQLFLLSVANTNVQLIVGKNKKSLYQKSIVSLSGEYTEIASNLPQGMSAEAANIPYLVTDALSIDKDRIKGVKNFNDYQ